MDGYGKFSRERNIEMKRKTLSATALAIYLSLNVEVRDDEQGNGVYTLPLVSLTWLLAAAWVVLVEIARLRHELQAVVQPWYGAVVAFQLHRLETIVQRWHVALVVVGIGSRSVVWGVGI